MAKELAVIDFIGLAMQLIMIEFLLIFTLIKLWVANGTVVVSVRLG